MSAAVWLTPQGSGLVLTDAVPSVELISPFGTQVSSTQYTPLSPIHGSLSLNLCSALPTQQPQEGSCWASRASSRGTGWSGGGTSQSLIEHAAAIDHRAPSGELVDHRRIDAVRLVNTAWDLQRETERAHERGATQEGKRAKHSMTLDTTSVRQHERTLLHANASA